MHKQSIRQLALINNKNDLGKKMILLMSGIRIANAYYYFPIMGSELRDSTPTDLSETLFPPL